MSGSVTPGNLGAMRAFSRCMRDNGVTDFPDPTDGGILLRKRGFDTDSPAFKYLGDRTRGYSPELTVDYGFVNGITALDYLKRNFPDADRIVVAGESAGSVAATVCAGLISDALPDAQISVFADSSGAYPNDPDLNTEILAQWRTFGTGPDWEVNDELTPQDWGTRRFGIQASLHDPDIVMARFDHAYEEEQTANMGLAGADTSDVRTSIDANEAAIEDAVVVQHRTRQGPRSLSSASLLHDGGRRCHLDRLGRSGDRWRTARRRALHGL